MQHASTIGESFCNRSGECSGYAYWHIGWVWGDQVYAEKDHVTAVEVTPIDLLVAYQVNGQKLTASSSYRTVCVVVTNFQGITQVAGSEASETLGYWISEHPAYDGLYWQVIGSGACATITWTYTNYQISDNTQLW
ncbi:hypothetical protein B9Q02_02170 [Candidatus Marsarchaeota G1 archaeon BE_D]|uniref:Uncharacterized protein n=1 Tax=Candidatus Marsarchaeota G1 archaeon BE_D TaxID=1978156 RepID=A0A2R6AJJ0_9ARCH|nr:MAG: hypothetical protein B9Q02_02170 [Candidatus Marsarchaeota G1 archaeon BE_D]